MKRGQSKSEQIDKLQTNLNNIKKLLSTHDQANQNLSIQLSMSEKLVSHLQREIIDKDKAILVCKRELENLHTGLSLADAIDKITISRSSSNRSRVAIAKAASDAVLSDAYLNGLCRNFLEKKTERIVLKNNEQVTEQQLPQRRSLQEIIEKDYLQYKFKANTHSKTKASHIFNELWSSDFLKGSLEQITRKKYTEMIRKENPYNQPDRVCKVMDLSGGVVNLSCINVLRQAENLEKYSRDGYMVSTNAIQKIQDEVHKVMDSKVPYKLTRDLEGVDGVEFDEEELLSFLLVMFKLDGIAREEGNVGISLTIDGADLSRNIQHVTCGVKISDPRAVNPATGIPIGLEGIQSREFCFPFKVLLAKDTKALYQTHFKDFFQWGARIHEHGFRDFKPFKVASPQDISSFWKCIGRGGACKRDKDFCHCCPLKSQDVIKPNLIKCVDCIRRDNVECYHHPVGDKKYLEDLQEQLAQMVNTYNHLFDDESIAKLTINLAPHDIFASRDIDNLDFEPQTDDEVAAFSNKLNYNLSLLKLSRRGNVAARREVLRLHLQALAKNKL